MFQQNYGKLYLERRSLNVWLSSAVLFVPFSFAVLQLVGMDDIARLIMDAMWLMIAVLPLLYRKLRIARRLLPFGILIGTFVLYTAVIYLFRYQSIFYYLWGFRNNFRFFAVFLSIASYFSEQDAAKCLKFLDRLFWINAAIYMIQFALGFRQDYLGGIFGVSVGCNGYLLVYLIIITSKCVLEYMNGTGSSVNCFVKCTASLIISACSELKFFFFMFVLILGMSAILTSFSFRKMLVLCIGAILVSVMAVYLGTLYDSFAGFFSLEKLWRFFTLENYASASDIGRFNAIPVINRSFLQNIPDQLFGMGLGNCDTSSMALFNTPFFGSYGDLHYTYFSYAMMYIENGYIGLTLYVLFFVLCFARALQCVYKKTGNRLLGQMALICSILCFILLFYNCSLRVETGYMIYFVLAFALIPPGEKQTFRSVNIPKVKES